MYSHLGDWVNAIRIAETYDPSTVPDVLVGQARQALESKDYARAESLFINAKKPELAIKAYSDAKMWNEAIRIAKTHLPHKLHEVNMERQRSAVGGGGSKDDYLAAAKGWEDDGEWGHAIDAYMNITREIYNEPNELEKIWRKAVEIAATNCKDRYVRIVEEVASRLVMVKKHESAADLFKDIGLYDQAIDCYIACNCWSKARAVAENNAPNSRGRVNKAYQSHLVEKKDADELVETGNLEMALDMYAQRGEWDKCMAAASSGGASNSLASKYALHYARDLVGKSKFEEAVGVLAKYEAPAVALELPFYQDLVMYLMRRTKDQEDAAGHKVIIDLRDFLYKLVSKLRASADSSKHPMMPEFEKLLLISHFYVLRKTCYDKGLKDIYAKITVSLLRYANTVPADKLFFEAAMACKEVGWLNMAFTMLNRYLDLNEAIEDENMSMVDNSDFAGTDIPPPHEYKMPKHSNQFVGEKKREEVREWLIQLSLENKVTSNLKKKLCSSCGAENFEASLVCHNCGDKKQACVGSGYPIMPSQIVTCHGCSSKFSKDVWNSYLNATRTCPWCSTMQNPSY
jgi:intraflagellar transport protein 172